MSWTKRARVSRVKIAKKWQNSEVPAARIRKAAEPPAARAEGSQSWEISWAVADEVGMMESNLLLRRL